uniref:Uncharacterized protein n=1 Tax=Siphoviridae sp. ctmP19 TaxID=2825651 RepID=A0A8S5PJ02_9CAUD|nr:MAG TPA: hypothetical protein [Siphoviridae sp. ctmP19]
MSRSFFIPQNEINRRKIIFFFIFFAKHLVHSKIVTNFALANQK